MSKVKIITIVNENDMLKIVKSILSFHITPKEIYIEEVIEG